MSAQINVKKIVNTMNLAALLAFFVIYTSDAFAQRGRRRPMPRPGQMGQIQVAKAHLYGETFYGPTRIPVKRIVKNQNYNLRLRGKKLKAVIVKASKAHYYGRGAVQLMINGYPVGQRVRLSEYKQRLVLPIYGPKVIGRDISTIQLKVFGTVQINMLGLKLKTQPTTRGRYPRRRYPRRRGSVAIY